MVLGFWGVGVFWLLFWCCFVLLWFSWDNCPQCYRGSSSSHRICSCCKQWQRVGTIQDTAQRIHHRTWGRGGGRWSTSFPVHFLGLGLSNLKEKFKTIKLKGLLFPLLSLVNLRSMCYINHAVAMKARTNQPNSFFSFLPNLGLQNYKDNHSEFLSSTPHLFYCFSPPAFLAIWFHLPVSSSLFLSDTRACAIKPTLGASVSSPRWPSWAAAAAHLSFISVWHWRWIFLVQPHF